MMKGKIKMVKKMKEGENKIKNYDLRIFNYEIIFKKVRPNG